jgi:hypothetical protein
MEVNHLPRPVAMANAASAWPHGRRPKSAVKRGGSALAFRARAARRGVTGEFHGPGSRFVRRSAFGVERRARTGTRTWEPDSYLHHISR